MLEDCTGARIMVALNGGITEDEERELVRVILLHVLDGDAIIDSPSALAANDGVIVYR